ncbi:MAG: cyclic nucleotide-binding domain-containing protein [Formivibrio sp.]|nr:cyclic nucleotide-binding domain-containing protein [Formivibrio sp.]
MPGVFFPARFCGEAADPNELREFQKLAVQVRVAAGKTIFSEGELADSVFGLSRGFVRLYRLLPDGRRQILGFALPGDFLGMPINDRHPVSADTIGEVTLSRFSRLKLANFILSSPNVLRLLMEFAARQLEMAQDQIALIGRRSAEEKVSIFLVNWRSRLARITGSSEAVPLPMPRKDIADFLGLTLETISRTFTKLEQRKAIRILPKAVVMLTGLEQPPLLKGGTYDPHILL